MLTLQPQSLDWALAHAMRYGDTDVFPVPFEYDAIRHDWDEVRQYLVQQNVIDWVVRPHRALLSPKAKYGFRVITQLDPLDFLVFTALVYEIAADIEIQRVPAASEIVLSYRVRTEPTGQFFDPAIGYRRYLEKCREVLDAEAGFTHVAIADIADFYPRIYHHRLDNALRAATQKASHVKAIMGLLSRWNGTETFGIPVGNAPSRVLAEITISDIDEALLARGIRFIRFNDDFRIFATSHSAGYRSLAVLADLLYRNHGLTLQTQKTKVLPVEDFRQEFLISPFDREVDSLYQKFEQLAAALGLNDPYEPIDYDALPEDLQAQIDAMNLGELFSEALAEDEPDLALIRFILRRLAQLGDDSVIEACLVELDKLHPAFPDIIRYLQAQRFLSEGQRHTIGGRILSLLQDSIITELDYHRLWALHLFSNSTNWNCSDRFVELYSRSTDSHSRRELILAMGRAGVGHWFKSQWRSLFEHPLWPRRALLAGMSCLPSDARKHWYKSVEAQLDPLERAVVRWAKANPMES